MYKKTCYFSVFNWTRETGNLISYKLETFGIAVTIISNANL